MRVWKCEGKWCEGGGVWGEVVGVTVWECEGKWCEGMEYMG